VSGEGMDKVADALTSRIASNMAKTSRNRMRR